MVSLTPRAGAAVSDHTAALRPWTAETGSGFRACVWGDPCPGRDHRRPGAPCTLSCDISVGCSALTGISRSQRALLRPPVLPLRLQEEPGSGVPENFLDPKVPRPTQGSCSSLGCSLRTRLTLTMQAGATGLLTATQVDGKLGREPQPVRGWFLENRQI